MDNLKGKLTIAFCLIAVFIIGTFFLGPEFFMLILMVALLFVCVFVILVRYPVLVILSIIGGTSLIPYYSDLPLTHIGSINIPDLILFLLVAVVIFRFLFLRVKLVKTPLDMPFIIFVGLGTASLLIGALEKKYLFFVGLLEFKPILYYLLPLLITNIIKEKKELKLLIYGCLALGVITAVSILLQVWLNPPTTASEAEDVFYRYKAISGLMLPCWSFLACVCLLLIRKINLSYIFAASITLFSVLFSFSRHLWISLVVGVLLVSLLTFKRSKVRIFGFLSLAIIFIFLVGTAVLLRVEPVPTYVKLIALRAESLTSGERIENWEIRMVENEYALKKIAGHPLFGIGYVSPYRPQIYGPDDNDRWYIHNGYLWILLKLGIAGLIPFLWFSYVFVRRGIKYWNQVADDILRPVVLGSVCSYLAIAVGNYAAPHFISNWEVTVFGLSMGINEVIYRLEGLDGIR